MAWDGTSTLGSQAVAAGSTSHLGHGHPPNRPQKPEQSGTDFGPLVLYLWNFMNLMSNAAIGGVNPQKKT